MFTIFQPAIQPASQPAQYTGYIDGILSTRNHLRFAFTFERRAKGQSGTEWAHQLKGLCIVLAHGLALTIVRICWQTLAPFRVGPLCAAAFGRQIFMFYSVIRESHKMGRVLEDFSLAERARAQLQPQNSPSHAILTL